jgi:Uma2 family endonuclease
MRRTVEHYYQMGEPGFFDDRRVELIDGEVIEMSPMKSAHAAALGLVAAMLRNIFGPDFHDRIQMPMSFGDANAPEPDVVILTGPRFC